MSFYVTTPIYYVNAAPHLGHAYTTIAADVMARHHRQRGERVFFLTGTDEHGEPVADAAHALGVTPQELADRNSQRFRELALRMDASNDFFIRTTDPEHIAVVQDVLERVRENGHVYKGTYEGWYCPRCADFKAENEIDAGNLCPIHHIELTREQEENYFFALSSFQERLEALYAEQPDFVGPATRRNEALSFIRSGLRDVPLTRKRLRWGVPVPWDEEHVFYVWFDALLNYYSALSYAPAPAEVGSAGVGPAGVGSAGVGPAEVGPAEVGPAGVGPAGVGPAGVGPAGVGPAGVESAGVGPAGVESAGVGPAGVESAGVGPAGVESAGVESAGVESAGVGPAGVGPAGVGSAGVGPVGVESAGRDPAGDDLTATFWPADCHLIGKDILRFHVVYWPALLMAAGLALPRRVFVHGYLLMDGEKMSKSLGNVLDPFAVIDRFGSDALRFYLLRDVSLGQDGSVSTAAFEQRYESELANEYGNLASRVLAMVSRYRDGVAPAVAVDPALAGELDGLREQVSTLIDEVELTQALEAIWQRVRRLNRYVEERAPWQLAKREDAAAELDVVLGSLVEGLRTVSVLLHPYLPEATSKLCAALGVSDLSYATLDADRGSPARLGSLEPLFPKAQ